MSQTADAFMGIFGLKRVKPKKCRVCKTEFYPAKPLQIVCGTKCAITHANIRRAKKEAQEKKLKRQQIKSKRESLKTRSDYIKEAQIAFNAYIRERDKDKPCICCGRNLADSGVGGGFDCGHYRSVGSAPHLRFNENNAHGQTKQCNRWGAGRAVDYRIGLVQRIGLAAVELLESDQAEAKWTIEDLKEIRDKYRLKLKELKMTFIG